VKSYTVEAFVLRRRHLGEADRILTLFSLERGKLSAVAKSARKAQSKFGARLDFFTRARFSLHSGKSLDVVTSVDSVRSIWDQLVDPDRYALASYICEIVDALCEPDLAQPELYAVLCEIQEALPRVAADSALFVAAADLRVLAALGVAPELEACAHCGATLGKRPLRGGRATLSTYAGGLLCAECVRALRAEEGHNASRGLMSLSARDFSALRAARSQPLLEAGAGSASADVSRVTHAFVEYQLGRRSKALAVVGAGDQLRRSAARRG